MYTYMYTRTLIQTFVQLVLVVGTCEHVHAVGPVLFSYRNMGLSISTAGKKNFFPARTWTCRFKCMYMCVCVCIVSGYLYIYIYIYTGFRGLGLCIYIYIYILYNIYNIHKYLYIKICALI